MSEKSKKEKLKKRQHKQKSPVQPVQENVSDAWDWYALAIVLVVTLAIYFNALKFDFLIWDDNLYINLNDHIKDMKWSNLKLFFTEFYAGNYQPITIITYAIEHKLVGEAASLFHFDNIVLHLINTVLVFVLIRKISPKSIYVAIITAAFFAVHPMHVESVAWIAERKDVLYTLFFLLSLILYTRYLESEKIGLLLFTGIFFLLSCLSKSAAVILPLLLFLIDYYLNRKYGWKMVLEKVPFFAISLIIGIVAIHSQTTAMAEKFISAPDRIFIVSNSFISYLVKAFFPVNLSAFYPYPSTLPITYYLSMLFIGILAIFVWYSRRWGKDVVFGFGFFCITIILVIQIVSVGNAAMADRYTYVPYIGIFFMVGKLFDYLAVRTNYGSKNYLSIILVVGFIVFSSFTYSRVKKWETDETLFTDVLEKYPHTPLAYNNRGCYYLKVAQNESPGYSIKSESYFKNAFRDFEKTIEIDENYIGIYSNRGLAEYFLKDYSNAIKDFDIEILRNPKDGEAYLRRGNAKKEMRDYAGAIQDFQKVIELNPKSENAYFTKGNTEREMNDFSNALKDYNKAIELSPNFLKAYNNRSILKCILKDYEGTIADYDKMIELNPSDTTTIKNRDIVRALIVNPK